MRFPSAGFASFGRAPPLPFSGSFSVYVQRYPTIEEQRAFWLTEVDHNALDTLVPASTKNRMKPKAIAMRTLISAPASR